jgi:hypothetical protein
MTETRAATRAAAEREALSEDARTVYDFMMGMRAEIRLYPDLYAEKLVAALEESRG